MSGAIRGRGRPGSTAVPNWRFEDATLDTFEFKIAAWLASHADRYLADQLSRNEIARRVKVSSGKVTYALQHLEALGIIEIESTGARDRLVITFDFDVWERSPHDQLLVATRPATGHDVTSTREQQVEDQERTPPTPPGGSAGDDGFDAFWAIYPRHEAKKTARERWAKMSEDDRRACLELTALWLQFQRSRCPGRSAAEFVRYLPHPAVYLNNRRWEDEVDVTPETGARARAQAAWRERRGK